MTRLVIRFLGGFEAVLVERPMAGFESDKVRALLAYLVIHAGRPQRREILTGLLWPDSPENSARASLRNALANLRRALGDHQIALPFLSISRQTITFVETGDYWLDVTVFNQALQNSTNSTEEDKSHLEKAISLYRGPLLDGFSVASIPFQDWLLLERERLNRKMVDALRRLTIRYAEDGQLEKALTHAWQQVELEPWEERGQRLLIRLLATSGRRSEALAQYAHCCRMLRETIRVEPSDETVSLYRQILAGEVPAVSSMPANNLPFWLTPLIGRQSEVNWVQLQLATPPCRLITITGPGGIGKTHMALEAIKAKLNRFPDGAFLVSLAELTSAQDIIPILVQVLNLPSQDNVDLRRQLFDYLRPKTLLLILDSFEYLIAAPGFASQSGTKIVCDLLEEIPRLKILITSRTRLNLHGEHVLTLNGLSYPPEQANYQSSDVVEPDEYSAITLFLNSALRLRPGYIPTAADLVDIGRICRQVRGMPLAILLAASWVELLKPRDIAEEIEQNLDFLTMESGNLPWRHRSLRAVFNHSLRLLSDRERAILLSLSVFRGGFTRVAAQAVVGASAQDLRYFVNRSLLRRFSEDRFTLHPLLRYYAAENLVANPEVNTRVCNQHCTFYTAASHDWMMLYKGPHQQAGIQQMKREIHNLQVAWRWAVKQRDRPSLAQGLDGLCTYYAYHNRYQEGIDICRDAARMIDKEQSPAGLRLMSRLLAWQSTFSMKLGRVEEALRLSQQALIILQDSLLAGEDFRPEKAFALLQFAQQLTECDLGKAEQLAKESVKLYQDLEDESGTADALEALAEVAWLSANYREAHDGYQRCLSIRRAIGDGHRIANLLGILGFVCFQLGDFEQAERLIHEGINLKQHLGDVNGATDTLFNLAMAMLWIGGCEEVNNLLSLAIASYHKSGAVIEAAKLQALQAMAQTLLGQYDEAREIAESSLALARNNRLEREIGILLWVLGFLSIAAGDYISAEQQLVEAHQLLKSLGLLDISAAAQVALGYAALGLEDLGLARQRFAEALQGQPGPQSRGVALLTLPGIALLMARIGHIPFSVAVDTLATRFPLLTKAPFFNDVARQPLAALLTDVDEAVLAQAKAHGEGLDLDTAVIEVLKALKQLPLSTE